MVVQKVMEGEGSFGFNAETGTYEVLMKAGIVDPTKVTRFALQNAASLAGLLMASEDMFIPLTDYTVHTVSKPYRQRAALE